MEDESDIVTLLTINVAWHAAFYTCETNIYSIQQKLDKIQNILKKVFYEISFLFSSLT